MEWYVGPHVRCDMVSYGGINLTGPRYVVRIFPTGSRKGTFRTHELKSIVILAPIGTRVILATHATQEGWEDMPWRCIRQLEGFRFKNDEGQMGVRIPDLDWMDLPTAKKVNPDRQEGFPLVKRLADGANLGFTFGRSGPTLLKDNVRAIWVEKESEPITGKVG